mmetsp:Transcript_3471/g.3822  ORF Transcript_3471/g.3822 Transcript_3471/m.3822 type:complete len:144 (-) Transcript_3471:91-522(-)
MTTMVYNPCQKKITNIRPRAIKLSLHSTHYQHLRLVNQREKRQAQAQMARSNNVHCVNRSVVWEERDKTNKAYKICNFDNAINLYTEAVEMRPDKNSDAYCVKLYLIAQHIMQTCASIITVLLIEYVQSNLMMAIPRLVCAVQ